RKVNTSGVISTYAGTGSSGSTGDGGQATAANMYGPLRLALDPSGNLYFSDTSSSRVRKITASTGIINAYAGNGIGGFNGDGGQATAATISLPYGLAVDWAGILYIGDYSSGVIRMVMPNGVISTMAGVGGKSGYNADNIPAASAWLNNLKGIAI